MSNDSKAYCGIVFIGGGSSWHWASTPEEAAKKTAEVAHQDWGSMFDMDGKTVPVNVLDMRKHEGWVADHRGIRDSETDEAIEVMDVIEVPLPERKRRRGARRK